MAAMAGDANQPGDVLGPYRLVRRLGATGGSFVAHDQLLDRAVVIRFVDARGLEAARALARVEHPHLQRIHRVGETPRPYVVSELLRGTPLAQADGLSSARSREVALAITRAVVALHRAGAAHGDLGSGAIVLGDGDDVRLIGLDRARPDASAAELDADRIALGRLVEELARRTPAPPPDRPATADEILASLEGRPVAAPEEDAPYRGLLAFHAEHRALFFGRRREVESMLARLAAEPWLVIAGQSGAGKSSLLRAGIAPELAGGRFGEKPRWDVVTIVPGRRPLQAFAHAFAPILDQEPRAAARALSADPGLAARRARRHGDTGVLVCIDQLEELFTIADPDERRIVSEVISRFGALAPGVRLIATVRSDFLFELGELAPVGADLVRAAAILGPMSKTGLREAIAGPAAARGVGFEDRAMVDELVAEAHGRESGLPLLSFFLAELWRERDAGARRMTRAAMRRLGGLAGSLARHGDQVLDALPPDQLIEARRMLVELVTEQSTRARRSEESLVAGRAAARRALDALIAGRLVVASPVPGCELAHEALAREWPRLHGWLEEASETRRAAERLDAAAREWDRLGRGVEGLWTERQLADVEALRDPLAPPGDAFVAASRRAVRRARRGRRLLAAAVPLALLAVIAAVLVSSRLDRADRIARLRAEAARIADLGPAEAEVEALRRDAFAAFDAGERARAEETWSRARLGAARIERARRDAAAILEQALAIAPDDAATRAAYADLLLARLRDARRDHKDALAAALAGRLAVHDDGSRLASLAEPRRAVPAPAPLRALPAGFVAIPPGDTWIGSRDDEATRGALGAAPAHRVRVHGFLIDRTEVRLGDYLRFLETLPPDEARRHAPAELAGGVWQLWEYRVPLDRPWCPRDTCFDPLDLPVGGIGPASADAYLGWLDATGRVPGARLCTALEWERAARGDDLRRYPHGDSLARDEACTLLEADGMPTPCPVGAHPRSASPFGVLDLTGGAFELVRGPRGLTQRGGSFWSESISLWIVFGALETIEGAPSRALGLRVCADWT